MKIIGFSLLAVLCVVLVVSFYLSRHIFLAPGATRQTFTPVVIRDEDPSLGKKDAQLSLVYFSSFTCPACRSSALTMDQLRAVYGDKIRIVRKDLPLDTDAGRTAALAARCAQQQGKFWQFHDELFSQQEKLATDNRIWLSVANDLNLDTALFTRCLNDRSTLSLIEQDINDATAADINSIPYFELNAKIRVAEDIPLSQWRQVIDSLLVL